MNRTFFVDSFGNAVSNVIRYVHMGKKGIFLKNHADTALLGRDKYARPADHLPANLYFTRIGRLEAG